MNTVQHCFNIKFWHEQIFYRRIKLYLKEKIVSEHDLKTVVKLTKLKLFCENELKVCNSLFLSGALKENAFHLQVCGNFA